MSETWRAWKERHPDRTRASNRRDMQRARGTETAGCPHCGERYALTPTGAVRAHPPGADHCPGSGRLP